MPCSFTASSRTHFYGTETYTLEVARHLRKRARTRRRLGGVPGRAPPRGSGDDLLLSRHPGRLRRQELHPSSPRRRDVLSGSDQGPLTGVLEDIRPEIVHVTHLINHTAVLLEVARDVGVPAVATLTDFFGFCHNNKLEAANGSLCRGPNRTRTNCVACYLKADAQTKPHWRARLVARSPWVSAAARGMTIVSRVPGFRESRIGELVRDLQIRPGHPSRVLSELPRGHCPDALSA